MPSPALNVAPAPGPAALTAPASNPAAPGTAAADGAPAAAGQPDNPFAAALQQQIRDQAAASPSAKDAAVLQIADGAAPGQAAAQPQTDALAALAPLLAGIVPPQPAAKNDDKKTDADETTAAAVPLAAPVQIPLVLATPAKPAEPAAAEPRAELGTALPLAANLAGDGVRDAVSRADSGKETAAARESFESLLAAAPKDPSLLAAGQATAAAAAPVSTPVSAPAATQMDARVGTPAWNGEIGDKLAWMATRHESRAELVLNPPHLGRLEISLSLNGDQASALFVSANPSVRDALENAVPRLREILQEAGITLGQAQVGAESFGQPSDQGKNGDNPTRGFGRNEDGGLPPSSFAAAAPARWARQGNGLVDTFA